MEPDFGRARAMAQKADNEEMLQESLDCCPVDCIHWVGDIMLAVCLHDEQDIAATLSLKQWQHVASCLVQHASSKFWRGIHSERCF